MPNAIALVAILVWPIVTVVMYMRLPISTAVIWSVLAAYMMLPQGLEIDLPLLPGLSKVTIPAMFGYVAASMTQGRLVPILPRSRSGKVLVLLLIAAAMGTALTNSQPRYITDGLALPGMRPYDALSIVVTQIGWLFVWALAREFLTTRAALRQLAVAVVTAFVFYSFLMLYEVRMSPQLHTKLYGYFQHSFDQMMRQGGFRPIVFLEHGLWIAMMTAMAILTALVLGRDSKDVAERRKWYRSAAWLGLVLVLCKSIAALVYTAALAPCILLLRGRNLLRIAVILACVVMLFPILRSNDLIPTKWLVEVAASYSPDRAQSLEFRFDNEDVLLQHAMERPMFGWGGWGRNFVFDPETGRPATVTDGLWIIIMGIGGYATFIVQFGLLALPIFLMGGAFRRAGREVTVFAGGSALVLAINLIDLLPNATLTPITWLFTGALLGYVERLSPVPDERPDAAAPVPVRRRSGGYAGLVGDHSPGSRSLI